MNRRTIFQSLLALIGVRAVAKAEYKMVHLGSPDGGLGAAVFGDTPVWIVLRRIAHACDGSDVVTFERVPFDWPLRAYGTELGWRPGYFLTNQEEMDGIRTEHYRRLPDGYQECGEQRKPRTRI